MQSSVFDKIQNPKTGRWVNLNGNTGRSILNKYNILSGGGDRVPTRRSTRRTRPPVTLQKEQEEAAARTEEAKRRSRPGKGRGRSRGSGRTSKRGKTHQRPCAEPSKERLDNLIRELQDCRKQLQNAKRPVPTTAENAMHRATMRAKARTMERTRAKATPPYPQSTPLEAWGCNHCGSCGCMGCGL